MAETKAIPLTAVDKRLGEIDEELEYLGVEREMLQRLRDQAIVIESNGEARQSDETVTRRTGVTDAILQVVAEIPGIRASELIRQVRMRATSSAKDVNRTIQSTMYNLCRSGKLAKNAYGKYRLPEAKN